MQRSSRPSSARPHSPTSSSFNNARKEVKERPRPKSAVPWMDSRSQMNNNSSNRINKLNSSLNISFDANNNSNNNSNSAGNSSHNHSHFFNDDHHLQPPSPPSGNGDSVTFESNSSGIMRTRVPSRNIVAIAPEKAAHNRLFEMSLTYKRKMQLLRRNVPRSPFKPSINSLSETLDEALLAKKLERLESEVEIVEESPWKALSNIPIHKIVPEKRMDEYEISREQRLHVDKDRWVLNKQYIGDATYQTDSPETARECSFTPAIITREEWIHRKRLAKNPYPPPRMSRSPSPQKVGFDTNINLDNLASVDYRDLEPDESNSQTGASESSHHLKNLLRSMGRRDSQSMSEIQSFTAQTKNESPAARANLAQSVYTESVEVWRRINFLRTQLKVQDAWRTRFIDTQGIEPKELWTHRYKFLEMLKKSAEVLLDVGIMSDKNMKMALNETYEGEKQIRKNIHGFYLDQLEEDRLELNNTVSIPLKLRRPDAKKRHELVEQRISSLLQRTWKECRRRKLLMLSSCAKPKKVVLISAKYLIDLRELHEETLRVIEFLSIRYPSLFSMTWDNTLSDAIILDLFNKHPTTAPSCLLQALSAYLQICGYTDIPREMLLATKFDVPPAKPKRARAQIRGLQQKSPISLAKRQESFNEKYREKEQDLKMKIASTLMGLAPEAPNSPSTPALNRQTSFSAIFNQRYQSMAKSSSASGSPSRSPRASSPTPEKGGSQWSLLQRAVHTGKFKSPESSHGEPTTPPTHDDSDESLQKISNRHLKLLSVDPKKISNDLLRQRTEESLFSIGGSRANLITPSITSVNNRESFMVNSEDTSISITPESASPGVAVRETDWETLGRTMNKSIKEKTADDFDLEIEELNDGDHVTRSHVVQAKEIISKKKKMIVDLIELSYYDFGDWMQSSQKVSNELWQRVRAIDRFLHSHDPSAKAKHSSEGFLDELSQSLVDDQTKLTHELEKLERQKESLDGEIRKMGNMLKDAMPQMPKSRVRFISNKQQQ